MKHKIRKIFASLIMVCLITVFGFKMQYVYANPYPQTYTDELGYHPGNCTWQAWQEVHNRLGIDLPGWGNAGEWFWNAQRDGYQTVSYYNGYVPPDNSIICWGGHVGFVLSADSVGLNLREGNVFLYTQNRWVDVYEHWISWSQLISERGVPQGFIIFNHSENTTPDLSYRNLTVQFVDNWNAGLYAEIVNPGRVTMSSVGTQIWDSTGKLVVDHSETCTLNDSIIWQSLNIVAEAKPDGLESGETYTFQMWGQANGYIFKSSIGSFTIQGEKPTPPTPTTPTTPPISPTQTPTDTPKAIYGDMNGNTVVDSADALQILRIAAELEPLTETALHTGDVNGSGSLGADDALLVLQKAARIIDIFPVEKT